MRSQFAVLVFLLCPWASGCGNLFTIGTRNLLYEANLIKDNCFERSHDEKLAQQAWREVVQACPDHAYSADYACGFKDGFMDFLYAGGNGQPPALPPKRYRRYHGMRPEGGQAVQDWYEGFRHGAAEARASGLRRLMILSLPPPSHPSPSAPPVLAGPPLGEPIPSSPPAALPMPRRATADSPTRTQAAPEGPPRTPPPAPPQSEPSTKPAEASCEEADSGDAGSTTRDPSPTRSAPPAAGAEPMWRIRKWGGKSSAAPMPVVEEAPSLENQP